MMYSAISINIFCIYVDVHLRLGTSNIDRVCLLWFFCDLNLVTAIVQSAIPKDKEKIELRDRS